MQCCRLPANGRCPAIDMLLSRCVYKWQENLLRWSLYAMVYLCWPWLASTSRWDQPASSWMVLANFFFWSMTNSSPHLPYGVLFEVYSIRTMDFPDLCLFGLPFKLNSLQNFIAFRPTKLVGIFIRCLVSIQNITLPSSPFGKQHELILCITPGPFYKFIYIYFGTVVVV